MAAREAATNGSVIVYVDVYRFENAFFLFLLFLLQIISSMALFGSSRPLLVSSERQFRRSNRTLQQNCVYFLLLVDIYLSFGVDDR